MTPSQIIDYVSKWWLGRETTDKTAHYSSSIHAFDNKDMEVLVKTPWNTYHTAIRVVWGDLWIDNHSYSCWSPMQYHFTGWHSINGLDRRRLHNMMLVQRKILETSPTL